ncbi:MAG: DNA-directed RNA polymerase subunit beta [Oscillospiraceae bacterium]|nr:DNA-directed RNA polymerase subunit beta [Oscillospiraceae bacterium]
MVVKPQKLGNNVRMSFSKIEEVLEMPNLVEVQKNSYRWFLDEGLMEVLRDVSPIVDYSGNLSIDFIGYVLDPTPKYPVEECKDRDVNFAAPLRITVRLENKSTGEVKQSEIYMGDFPLMTENGSFIINGAERVVVSQIVRSPGIYYESILDKSGKKLSANTVIPYRGAWLEYETDINDVFYVRIDKNRKIPITVLIRALGINSSEEIKELFGEGEKIMATLEKDSTPSEAEANGTTESDEALKEIYRKLRPGDPPLIEGAKLLVNNLFFDPKRYDLSTVGRYKFNKKLALAYRIEGFTLSRPAVSTITGEILAEAGEKLTRQAAEAIEDNGINEVYIAIDEETEIKVFSNDMIYAEKVLGFDISELGLKEKVKFSVLQDILQNYTDESDIKEEMKRQKDKLVPKHIIKADIFSSINYLICLGYGVGETDDIDHLGNRRLRSVGELLQNQMRIGFARMDKVIKERMTTQDPSQITPQSLINIRPLVSSIKEFFGSNPLSQFMDQTNPVSELTHKRRISALGLGGLSRERASFEVRDVHYTHYGRMCPIETPEGPNIGLISYLATYAKINQYGFIQAPYRKIDKETGEITDEIVYMTADREDEYYVVQANEPLTEDHKFFKNPKVAVRHKNEILEVEKERADFIDVSPKMLVSMATALIPFLENDDNSRALMGSNMQKQAVPLMISESPIVGTGMEYKIAIDSGAAVIAKEAGTVEYVSADQIIIKNDEGQKNVYHLLKFKRSNQGTCINQRPIVSVGQRMEKGEVIADGPATDNGEISIGKNVLIGFMTWEGYNYEDAVLINERLVREDVYTSIHIEEYSHEAKDTKIGPEEITKEIPNIGDDVLKNLTSDGIVRKGAEVRANDILVGKITPKGETELLPEDRLLRAIFGEKSRDVRDTSLRLPHGESGIVVDVKTFSRENYDELPPGVNKVARVYVAQKRKISVGDKMAGRHGNKGVISRILPPEDMPFLPDGTPLDIVLNPLGVPSRMNIGQVLEVHLGIAAKHLGWKVMTPVFDGANEYDTEQCLIDAGLDPDGKTVLYDGRTGMPFDNRVTVGYMYFLKLLHLVDDKIHARSTGPYSLVTQQPLGGKAQFGGQRFGEMEVWALEAYGAAYTLQEILTVKSDDMIGRVKTYEAIVKGQNIPTPGVPESFKVLIKELQSLGLDIRVLDKEMREVHIKESSEEDIKRQKSIDPDMIGESVIGRDDLDGIGYSGDDGYRHDDEDEYGQEYDDDELADYPEAYDGDIEEDDDYDE